MESICIISFSAYSLFDDMELSHLLRCNGVDLTRPLRFNVIGETSVVVHYDDTFIGAGI